MQESLETEFGPIQIRRRKGRRRLSIVMHPRRPVEVRANLRTSLKEIQYFLLERRNWIQKNLTEFHKMKEAHPEKKVRVGEPFPLFGKDRVLNFYSDTSKKKIWARFKDQELQVMLPAHLDLQAWKQEPACDLKPLIKKLYREVGEKYLSQRVEALSFRMQCFPTKLSFGQAQTLWGTCQRSGHIRLNWKLMVFNPEVIDYVVVHELAHLVHLNHSKSFWALVGKHCIDFLHLRKVLKSQSLMSGFLE